MSSSRTREQLTALAGYLLGVTSSLLVTAWPGFSQAVQATLAGVLGLAALGLAIALFSRGTDRPAPALLPSSEPRFVDFSPALPQTAAAPPPPPRSEPIPPRPLEPEPVAAAVQPLPVSPDQIFSPLGPSELPVEREAAAVALERPLTSAELAVVWQRYLEEGDGHFNPSGLNAQLVTAGYAGQARAGATLGLPDWALVVETDPRTGHCLAVPDFRRLVHEVAALFDHPAGLSRLARIRRLLWVAEGRLEASGFVLLQKGRVE